MEVSEKGLAVVKAFEGRALRAYRDAVGVWTVGYGSTNADKFAVAYLGKPIAAGVTITAAQADYLLRESIRRGYGPTVERALGAPAVNAYDAGVSFHFNTGAIKRASWVSKWKSGAAAATIRAALMSWNKAGGKVLAGLTRRRSREAAILLSGDYGPEGRLTVNNSLAPVVAPGMLATGATGGEVEELHADLVALGYKLSGSVYTPATAEAVRSFQSAHPQLNADGVVGPATRAAITREAAAKRKLSKAAGTVAGSTSIGAAADHLAGLHISTPMIFAAGAVVLVAVLAWFAWHYRDEVRAILARG